MTLLILIVLFYLACVLKKRDDAKPNSGLSVGYVIVVILILIYSLDFLLAF